MAEYDPDNEYDLSDYERGPASFDPHRRNIIPDPPRTTSGIVSKHMATEALNLAEENDDRRGCAQVHTV